MLAVLPLADSAANENVRIHFAPIIQAFHAALNMLFLLQIALMKLVLSKCRPLIDYNYKISALCKQLPVGT